jgi:hypothetical protein
MIECEFSAISRQCLDRRIATIEHLRSEVLALLEEREAKAIKIHWQFSIQAARTKLNKHYTTVCYRTENSFAFGTMGGGSAGNRKRIGMRFPSRRA